MTPKDLWETQRTTEYFRSLGRDDLLLLEFFNENNVGKFQRSEICDWALKKYAKQGFREQDFKEPTLKFFYSASFRKIAKKLTKMGFLTEDGKTQSMCYSVKNPEVLGLWFSFYASFKKNLKNEHIKKAIGIAGNLERTEKIEKKPDEKRGVPDATTCP